MKNIIKTFSLLTICALIPGAFAATSRVSVTGNPATRLPSIAGKRSLTSSIVSIASNGSTTAWLSSSECIDSYTNCLKESDVCGTDLEECTNDVLLHAKMPSCLNVLTQCKNSDIPTLFGNGATISNLYSVSSYNANDSKEVEKYTYPTDTSVIGQMISAAKISNRLSASQCVKKYTNCLQKDNVCGSDFELCTGKKAFKKNAIMCESTLARCQSDGKTELFGDVANAKNLTPDSGSRLDTMITDGAALAATNTLATCNKVADQCILNACAANPTRCIAGINKDAVRKGDILAKDDNSGSSAATTNGSDTDKSTEADVKKFIKGACLDTIGSNKYCYIVYKAMDEDTDGKHITDKISAKSVSSIINNESFRVSDDDMSDVFDDIYANRKGNDGIKRKISDLMDAFDTKAKDACRAVVSECAMNACGQGLGSLCYKQVFIKQGYSTGVSSAFANSTSRLAQSYTPESRTFGSSYGSGSINKGTSYNEIKNACSAVVNMDANCQYAYANDKEKQYDYSYIDETGKVFNYVFPTDDSDPIGVIGSLNASLASSYNEAAIANMKKQCKNTAISCVKAMCGTDYTNCYRNRTDISAGTYATGDAKFNRSMNKVGGVLDYNIVTGLCLNTITSAKSCEEHLKIAAAEWRTDRDSTSWKDASKTSGSYDTVRAGWLDSNSTGLVLVGCVGSADQAKINSNCDTYTVADCGETDANQCSYTVKKYDDAGEYALKNAGTTLFQEVLADIEREVQAIYNAKLTKEQNICLANNQGGVRGANELGSTFMWVKLKNASGKVPNTYQMQGLKSSEFTETGDLYGAFCRVRVTVKSDDKKIQDAFKDDATAYFAVGDSFTCGSWITEESLNSVAKKIGLDARKDAGEDSDKEKVIYAWSTIAGALGSGAIGTGLTESGTISGLLSKADKKMYGTRTGKEIKESCLNYVSKARTYAAANDIGNANSYARSALEECKLLSDDGCPEEPKGEDGKPISVRGNIVTLGSTPVTSNKQEFVASLQTMKNVVDEIWRSSKDVQNTYQDNYTAFTSFVVAAIKAPTLVNGNNTAQKAVEACNTLMSKITQNQIEKICTYTPWTQNGSTTTAETTSYVANNLTQFDVYLSSIDGVCRNAKDVTEAELSRNKAARITIPIVTTIAGGALGAGIAASVLKVRYEEAENEAIKQWLQDLSNHIHCYVGEQELGSYGDTVSVTID